MVILSLSDLLSTSGIIENVLNIPPCESAYGNLVTEFNEANEPLLSLPCIGLAIFFHLLTFQLLFLFYYCNKNFIKIFLFFSNILK